jgi:cytochrome c553
MRTTRVFASCGFVLVFAAAGVWQGVRAADRPSITAAIQWFLDATGLIATYNANGPSDQSNPFFQSLGTNGRSCATCHDASQAMSITPGAAQQRYASSRGTDPLFASVDGANCEDVQPGDRAGHSLLLKHGLIRVGVALPTGAEFTITVVRDPYGCALRQDPATGQLTVSVYRRPLPSANLAFLSAVMWDARETVSVLGTGDTFRANLRADLLHQAMDATLGHAQAAVTPTDAQLDAIVDFELGLSTAQSVDHGAGPLDAAGASGGPLHLAAQTYYPGINDSLGGEPTGAAFKAEAMQLFSAWEQSAPRKAADDQRQPRAEIAAGEKIFNTQPLTIADVRGLNDNDAISRPKAITGTCTSCHDTPNVGNHSLPLPLDIGTSHSTLSGTESDPTIAAALSELNMPDLPVFLVQGCSNPFDPGEPASFYTTDPGRALITGHCSDFNRVKGPVLRGLAGRAPYFHNGAAADLEELVSFYDKRFQMNLTNQQKRQLVAFLNAL